MAKAQRVRGSRSQEVRAAAAHLFAENGYAGTNMADIADTLGLLASSLYNHISSKQEVLRSICLETMDELLTEQREATAGGDVAQRLRRMTEANVRFAGGRRDEAIVTDREFVHLDEPARLQVLALRRRYEAGVRSLIEEGCRHGVFRVRDPKLASYGIIKMGLTVAEWFRETGPTDLQTIAEEYGTYALRIAGADVSG